MAPALSAGGQTAFVWSAEDVDPAAVEAALAGLMAGGSGEDRLHAPARMLNLVVVTDAEWKGEISNRLDRIARNNPARTIVVIVDPDATVLSASAMLLRDRQFDESGEEAQFRERVELRCPPDRLARLSSTVAPILATDVGTVVWSPHGHPEAVASMRGVATSFLIDSAGQPDPGLALLDARDLSSEAGVVDLAWLRSTPWRERTAAAFDPLVWRPRLALLDRVQVRIQPGSVAAAMLWLGWLAAGLGWQTGPLEADASGGLSGVVDDGRDGVALEVVDDLTMPVPGLAGVTLVARDGTATALDRGAGGLVATRTGESGDVRRWPALGASRGEDGILAHAVAHGLNADPLYGPSLGAAIELLGASV